MLWTTNTNLNIKDRYHTNALDNKHKLNIKDRYHTNALDNKHKPQHKR